MQEYLSCDRSKNVLQCDLTDFQQVEKNFDENEATAVADQTADASTTSRMKSGDVIKVLKQFIESSNYADFAVRMGILKSFEQYLFLARGDLVDRRRNTLITILHNIHQYFGQFTGEIEVRLKAQRSGVEKKLKEFVKMESYSKYLSYFSQDANIAMVHRKLHKFLKDFEQQIGERIASVFVLKDSQLSDVHVTGELKSANKAKIAQYAEAQSRQHLVDVAHFVCASKRPDFFHILTESIDAAAQPLLLKADKMFARSRNIVKHAILHSPYQQLIYNLHQLLGDHIESLDYLRALEVDRTQEKPKQKVQAKQILQQKRKALNDFYKLLTRLGFSYRAGLMEAGLTAELIDLKIAPFCVRTMIASADGRAAPRFQPNLLALGEHIDDHFVKGVYKLKVLQTVLLTPHADIGMQHMDRIKGFAVDMFLLVQAQRKALSAYVLQLNDLRQHVRSVSALQACVADADGDAAASSSSFSTSFEHLRRKYEQMRIDLAVACDVIQQYQLLFKCTPSGGSGNSVNHVLLNSTESAAEKYASIRGHCADILGSARALLADLHQQADSVFYNATTEAGNDAKYAGVCASIGELLGVFVLDASNVGLHGRSLVDLQQRLLGNAAALEQSERSDEIADEFANANVEIENIIHSMLYSMQQIYKKYSDYELEGAGNGAAEAVAVAPATDGVSSASELPVADEEDPDPIQLNHLKVLVSLGIHNDVGALNVHNVTGKLANILLTIRHSDDAAARLAITQKIVCVLPILEQYQKLCLFYLVQQLSAHKVSSKMMAITMTVFVELGAKGFCVPPDLMTDEDGDAGENKEEKGSEGFGLEDGTGEKDVSDK